MPRILFICHGNICRSTMAEALMKEEAEKRSLGDCFIIESRATSREEIGNRPHHGTMRMLREKGYHPDRTLSGKRAEQISLQDLKEADHIYCMDHLNLRNMERLFGRLPDKVSLLLEDREVRDPWYTGDFRETYEDLSEGIERIFRIFEEGRR